MSQHCGLEGLRKTEALDGEVKSLPPSDLIPVSIPLRLTWISRKHEQRTVWANTLLVNRRGATIAVDQKLEAVLEISISLVGTERETAAQVLGSVGQDSGRHVYGIELTDPSNAPWLPELLNTPEVEVPASPFFLECAKCLKRAQVQLGSIHAYVFGARRLITLPCSDCGMLTTWGLASYDSRPSREEHLSKTTPASKPKTENQRQHNRIGTKLSACVRSGGGQFEEVVRVRDFSKGGFRFQSQNHYPEGVFLQVAMPFTPNAANIFVPVRIVWRRNLKHLEKYEYGVCYQASGSSERRK